MFNGFDGYKTYGVALVCAILGVIQILRGQPDQGVQLILGGAAAAGLRSAVAKTE